MECCVFVILALEQLYKQNISMGKKCPTLWWLLMYLGPNLVLLVKYIFLFAI